MTTPDHRFFAGLPRCKATGKVSHKTKRRALAHQRRLERDGRVREGGVINAYECRHCGCWHVGHSSWQGRGR